MLEGSNFSDRLKKISESKAAKEKRDEFLKTDYGYPSFLTLYNTIQEMSNELKNYGIDITVYLTTDDPFTDDEDKFRKNFIYIESEGGNFGIEFKEKWFLLNDDPNVGRSYDDDEPDGVKTVGIDIFYNYNDMDNKPAEKQAYNIQIDDNCNVLWGHFSPIELAKDIAERIVRKLE
ncbi:hypothetical protein [Dyadobacter bucti]|jgi:hypothetical protein|uniref:hypothetical protein n=1 Tax=Dyadobacter bucti TaxID=2572203 RepID=UPI001109742C|nr:hypothetical protein [Dyadobacter bucti]